ncbi:hypothetical protein C7420_101325 [Pantoea ananatis]|nr:hypothetical protein C7421_10138 [Pantoea ananatis]RAR74730.1 hypothetical protein C7420_101325 [Pantoea ananatis]REF11148.1 hypothetical protein C7428_0328 [Pantoea ananatis]CRH37344.1 hypothetical protein BN1184_AN_00200 [Pantoea ananatis]
MIVIRPITRTVTTINNGHISAPPGDAQESLFIMGSFRIKLLSFLDKPSYKPQIPA